MTAKKILIPIIAVFATIAGSIAFFFKNSASTTTTSTSTSTSTSTNSTISDQQQNLDQSATNPNQLQKLAVLPQRCIGCGKCARIDAQHFEINPSTGKAIVISSTNLNSQNLAMAIQACPAQAITLE